MSGIIMNFDFYVEIAKYIDVSKNILFFVRPGKKLIHL